MLFTTRPTDELRRIGSNTPQDGAKASGADANSKAPVDDAVDVLAALPADAFLGLVELSWDRQTLHQVCFLVLSTFFAL
jgi:hypothetical protein